MSKKKTPAPPTADDKYKPVGDEPVSQVCLDALLPAMLMHGAARQSFNTLGHLSNADLVNQVTPREKRVAITDLSAARTRMGDDPNVPNVCEAQIDKQLRSHGGKVPAAPKRSGPKND